MIGNLSFRAYDNGGIKGKRRTMIEPKMHFTNNMGANKKGTKQDVMDGGLEDIFAEVFRNSGSEVSCLR